MTLEYDETYEMHFDGDLGSLMSLDAHGHLDDDDVELFMASTVTEHFYDTLDFGFEVERLWRTEHPYTDGDFDPEEIGERWTYEYDATGSEGAVAVTRFQVASPWASTRDARTRQSSSSANAEDVLGVGDARSRQSSSATAEDALMVEVAGVRQRVCPSCGRGALIPPSKWTTTARCDGDGCSYQLPPERPVAHRGRRAQYTRREDFGGWADRFPLMCINHPDEPATTGIPAEQVIDADDAVIDGSVHMCHPCAQRFHARMAKARQRAVAPLNIERFLEVSPERLPEWEDREMVLAPAELRALLTGDPAAVASVRTFSERWHAKHDGATVIAHAPGNYALLSIRDIDALTEDAA